MKINFNDILNKILSGELEKEEPDEKMKVYNKCGILGTISKSENQQFLVTYSDGYLNNGIWVNGKLALLKDNEVVYKTDPERPNNCLVSNNGIVICCDWLNSSELTGKFIAYDNKGNITYTIQTTANIKTSSMSDDGSIAVFLTYASKTEDSEKVFVIDISNKVIVNKFDIPVNFKRIIIDSIGKRIAFIERDEFIYETDYNGTQVNLNNYEEQIFSKGNSCDKLWFFSTKDEKERYSDKRFEKIVTQAFNDELALEVYEKAFLLKLRGEYYLHNNQLKNALKDWTDAITLKPKIGLKGKIESLKKKIDRN